MTPENYQDAIPNIFARSSDPDDAPQANPAQPIEEPDWSEPDWPKSDWGATSASQTAPAQPESGYALPVIQPVTLEPTQLASEPSAAAQDAGDRAAPQSFDLADLEITMPKLRERGKGKGKQDLLPQAVPQFTANGAPVQLRTGEDYQLAFFPGARTDDAQASEQPLDRLTEHGDYRVQITGTSSRLTGQATVAFAVQKRRSKKPLVAALLAVLAAAGVFTGLYFTGNTPWYDPNAGEGLAGLHEDDVRAYLDMKVQEGMMNMTVLSAVIFEDGTMNPNSPGEIGFNNVQGNHYDQKLTITLDDTHEVVYESGAIAPGQNIQYITLNRELDPGIYDATATITGYNRETHAEEGSLAAQIRIAVRD